MTDSTWPQLNKGRPVEPGIWKQPPGRPQPPEPKPGDPQVVDASLLSTLPPAASAVPDAPAGPPRVCLQCGGQVDADGYCTQCGAKAPNPRDHVEESPAAWVGGVCDRGVRHARNEDALATAADDAPSSRAALVVCDGVTSSDDSDVASLAAARAARDVLFEGRPETFSTPASRTAAVTGLFARAAAVANDAVASTTKPGAENPAACTFVGALVLDSVVYAANVGDSRAYWLPDVGEGRVLTRDDSMAEESIAAGVPRKQAEDAADAHTITRWLGIDAQDVVPSVTTMHVPGPGWVLVCSDGLWNYASEPAAVAKVLADAVTTAESRWIGARNAGPTPPQTESAAAARPVEASVSPSTSSGSASPAPVDIARAMVDWAIAQGGHDNISAVLARVGVPLRDASLPDDVTAKVVRDPDTIETPAVVPPAVSEPTGPQPGEPVSDPSPGPASEQLDAQAPQTVSAPVPEPASAASGSQPPAQPAPGASEPIGYDPITHQPVSGGATAVHPRTGTGTT